MGKDPNPSSPADKPKVVKPANPTDPSGKLAFSLVVIMLLTLFILVLFLLGVAAWNSGDGENNAMLEFCKWAFSSLLGAFGAWIGAGAAYFFGKENLAESRESTKQALQIQQETLSGSSKPVKIRDLTLTAMNKEFMFNGKTERNVIKKALEHYDDYWWVPIFDDEGKGRLEDVVHARVFLDAELDEKQNPIVSEILENLDKKPKAKKLHGPSFFIMVTPEEKIADVVERMNNSNAAVGIVVDEKNKPTYCFTKSDIASSHKR